MPPPERLTTTLVLEQGDITLTPPRASDIASILPDQAWKNANSPKERFEHYRLFLARYTSKFPAIVGLNGSTPTNQNILAWVIYSVPNTPIPSCGGYGVDAEDAHSGESLGSMGSSPGP